MDDPTKLFERSADRYEPSDLSLEGVVRRRDIQWRNRRLRAATLSVLVAVLAVGGLIRAFNRSTPPIPASTPGAITSPGRAISITGPPEGVETIMTIDEVEAHALDLIRRDEERIGGALGPARILSISYLETRQPYRTWGGGSFSHKFPTWAVEFKGTYLGCGSYCVAYPHGLRIFADALNPDMQPGGGAATGKSCLATGPGLGNPPEGVKKKFGPCVFPTGTGD